MSDKIFKSITVDANGGNVDCVTDFVDDILASHDLPMKFEAAVNVIIDEIFSNIVSYSESPKATVSCAISDNNITIRFEDMGVPYDPLAAQSPDTTLSVEERSIGGLGIFMVKKMSDRLEYEYTDEKNILTVTLDRKK